MHKLLLILHVAAFSTGLGMSFANLMNARLAAKYEGEAFKALGRLRLLIARIGDGVIAAIWVTGVALYVWRGGVPAADERIWFFAKIAAAVLLTACHFGARRTAGALARSGDRSLLTQLARFIAGVWLSALAALALAVLAFA